MSAPDSIAKRITLALTAMLQSIVAADGYHTDAGLRVYRGRAVMGPDDLAEGPLVVIGPTPERDSEDPVDQQPQKLRHELRLTVTAVMRPESEADPLDTAHNLLADLKRALLRPDTPRPVLAGEVLGEEIRYAGATLTVPEPGEQIVSAAVHLTVRYSERRGDPTST